MAYSTYFCCTSKQTLPRLHHFVYRWRSTSLAYLRSFNVMYCRLFLRHTWMSRTLGYVFGISALLPLAGSSRASFGLLVAHSLCLFSVTIALLRLLAIIVSGFWATRLCSKDQYVVQYSRYRQPYHRLSRSNSQSVPEHSGLLL
ncbi:hypothetical protein F4779DRAFT_612206 [Xylariaceae sp. FL0662B]|nr:hypothetical protein F4779DRAFT_612206 [Xylariaceae sp. FL0662B]